MKIRLNKRKGVFLIDALFFCIFALSICVFSWDVSRVMYYKVYNQNLASILAISVVNESGYYITGSNGGETKGYLVTTQNSKNGVPRGFTGEYADEPGFLQSLKNKNAPLARDCEIVDVNLNDHYTNYDRFNTGSDGINGEAQVKTTLKVEMFLPNVSLLTTGRASKNYVQIQNIATAIPLYYATSDSTGIDWNSYDGDPSSSGFSKYWNNGYQIVQPNN